MANITTPMHVTHDELTIWINALLIGAGSQAEVARLLGVSQNTIITWRRDEQRVWAWHQRDVMQAAVTHTTTHLRTEMVRARSGSARYNKARRRLRGMNATIERLPYDAFDAITPAPSLSPVVARARAFIEERLQGKGAVDVKRIHRAAEREGISAMALTRAAGRMGVIRRVRGRGDDRRTTWELGGHDEDE